MVYEYNISFCKHSEAMLIQVLQYFHIPLIKNCIILGFVIKAKFPLGIFDKIVKSEIGKTKVYNCNISTTFLFYFFSFSLLFSERESIRYCR